MRDYQREVDSILRDTERRLRDLLVEVAVTTDPFPILPGSVSRLVEVDPPPVHPPDRGLIAVAPDGELYEFDISFGEGGDARDTIRPVDLPPIAAIVFVAEAIMALKPRDIGT